MVVSIISWYVWLCLRCDVSSSISFLILYIVLDRSSSLGFPSLSVLITILCSCASIIVAFCVLSSSCQAVLFIPIIMSCGLSSLVWSVGFVSVVSWMYPSWSGFVLCFHIRM